jgi:hypothetical protein
MHKLSCRRFTTRIVLDNGLPKALRSDPIAILCGSVPGMHKQWDRIGQAGEAFLQQRMCFIMTAKAVEDRGTMHVAIWDVGVSVAYLRPQKKCGRPVATGMGCVGGGEKGLCRLRFVHFFGPLISLNLPCNPAVYI